MHENDSSPKFKRVLLKLSGEALKGDNAHGLDGTAIATVAVRIKSLTEMGVQTAVVVGGGNFFRGLASSATAGVHRTTGDNIGMLATVMNGLALRDGLEAAGLRTELMTAKPIPGMGCAFSPKQARDLLDQGICLVFAGGTGCPFFTTDTTAALRACEIEADAVMKATKVDGVYTADPKTDNGARRFRQLSFDDALEMRLGIMDSTAFSLCRDNDMSILVFDFNGNNNMQQVVRGDFNCGTLVGSVETRMD
jgi:uridylate kinase